MEYISGIKLQDIFLLYWDAYCDWYQGTIREAVIENVKKIMKCRSFELGYHMFKCPKCSTIRLMPHSCKSRFCTSCGKIATDKWTEQRLSDILNVGYHHIVFTIPWQLRSICLSNRQIVINILFSAAALSLDHKKWIHAPENYLMPEKGLKARWRFNVISGLIKANNKGLLTMPVLRKTGQYLNLRAVIAVISKITWYIYIGARLLEVGMSVKYIGRYTKRPVIAETRIIKVDSKWIIFKYKDYAEGGKTSIKKMGLYTFITRLTSHIPDKHFRVVRAYGILSNRKRGELLPLTRQLLGQKSPEQESSIPDWRERQMLYNSGQDPLICENCATEMELVAVVFWKPDTEMMKKLGYKYSDRIPTVQFQLTHDTS